MDASQTQYKTTLPAAGADIRGHRLLWSMTVQSSSSSKVCGLYTCSVRVCASGGVYMLVHAACTCALVPVCYASL